MAINLYGNIDGHIYRPQTMNLFEAAKRQDGQPVTVREAGLLEKSVPVKVSISEEGLRALHGTSLAGSADPEEARRQIAFWSEHQPIESFTSRFAKDMRASYDKAQTGEGDGGPLSFQGKADALLESLRKICDEIYSGYGDGTRIRYMEDAASEDGFKKLTMEDELDILKKEFDEFVDYRFGGERQKQSETVAKSMNEFQKVKVLMGYGEEELRHYQPEKIPEGFAEQIKRAAQSMLEMQGKSV